MIGKVCHNFWKSSNSSSPSSSVFFSSTYPLLFPSENISAKIFLVVASVFNSMCESSTIQIFAIMKKKMELMLKFAVIKTKEKELGHHILCFFL